jgi:hypothetical protein
MHSEGREKSHKGLALVGDSEFWGKTQELGMEKLIIPEDVLGPCSPLVSCLSALFTQFPSILTPQVDLTALVPSV